MCIQYKCECDCKCEYRSGACKHDILSLTGQIESREISYSIVSQLVNYSGFLWHSLHFIVHALVFFNLIFQKLCICCGEAVEHIFQSIKWIFIENSAIILLSFRSYSRESPHAELKNQPIFRKHRPPATANLTWIHVLRMFLFLFLFVWVFMCVFGMWISMRWLLWYAAKVPWCLMNV